MDTTTTAPDTRAAARERQRAKRERDRQQHTTDTATVDDVLAALIATFQGIEDGAGDALMKGRVQAPLATEIRELLQLRLVLRTTILDGSAA